jgi:predicted glycogen debranching enzyme
VASLHPVVDRAVLLSKIDEVVLVDGHFHELGATQYPGVVLPSGYEMLEEFRLDPFPTWTWKVGQLRLEKRLFLLPGEETVVIEYRASGPCRLQLQPFIAFRNCHALMHENDSLRSHLTIEPSSIDQAVAWICPYPGMPSLALHYAGSASHDGACWYRNVEYLGELDRGLDYREDIWRIGTIEADLTADRNAWLVATTQTESRWDRARVATEVERARERRRATGADVLTQRLTLAADAYRARRVDGSPTVMAGFPWFVDWGRDTMISLPGLLIARGELEEARDVMTGFLDRLDQGLIPNRFVEGGEPPEYNTVDGTLWLFQAVRSWLEAGGNAHWAESVFLPHAREIIAWHIRGTHHGIHVDVNDGLLVAGNSGTQLTWMDAKVGDQVMTPRHGKPVEINALWIAALRFYAQLARQVGDRETAGSAEAMAERAAKSFRAAFWNAERGCLYDVLQDEGPDARVRPNQVFAVSLPGSPLTLEQQQSVMRVVEAELLTPVGLRTLAPGEVGYRGRYDGGPFERDSAYHQGTVWPWLLGPFITAYLNAFGRTKETLSRARGLIQTFEHHIVSEGCLGQIAEVFDGDAPHRPGGCIAQAWSVAEPLRILLTDLD